MARVETGSRSPEWRASDAPEQFLIGHYDTDCRGCGSCVRHCPARAIRVDDDGAHVIPERCVKCGQCVTECGRAGFEVRDDLAAVRALLASGGPVVAVLASEHVAAMHPLSPEEVDRSLEALGFAAVETTVLGEELVAAAYEQVHGRNESGLPRLRSTCPVAVAWVERFYPQLVDVLVPVVPPYIAQARLVKEIYPDDVAVVYVSPCWARKDEIFEPHLAGAVDVAIGFDELKRLVGESPQPAMPLDTRPGGMRRPQAAKELSLTDGFPRRTVAERDLTGHDLVTVRGLDAIDRLLSGIVRGETAPAVVDMLNCEGCADGPAVHSGLSLFAKHNILVSERERQPASPVTSRSFLSALPPIELRRSFNARPALSRVPAAEEIDEVLAAGEFASREEVLDCGACGYDTCVEHAAAICLGNSTWDVCFPLQRKVMARERERLTEHALTDPLTGLGNRRAFDQRLAEEVARVGRHSEPLSLMMMDLDNFKDVNDAHGHVFGDQVITAVGVLLKESLRTSDIAARYGGDEFAVILPSTSKTEAWVVAEKLRLSLQSVVVEGAAGASATARASIGVASFGSAHDTAQSLLHAADSALYAAKHGGRDRVELAVG